MKDKISIEIIGMPGSGKSFYQNMLLKKKFFKKKKIIIKNFKILNKIKKIKYIFSFFFKYPIFFLKTLFLVFSIKDTNLKRRYFYYFYNEIALWSYFIFSQKKGIFINSEGFNYRSAFYFLHQSTKKKLIRYLNSIPKTDIIIFLNSSKFENINRANSRKKEFNYKDIDIKNYDKQFKLLKTIFNYYRKKKDTKLFFFKNNKKNVHRNLNKFKNFINNESITY
jgi:hypothetical protein